MSKITKIEIQKNRKDRVNLYVDNDYFCGTQLYVVVKNRLKEGQEIDEKNLEELIIESEKNDALNKVAKLLERTIKTEKQIRKYLKDKGFSDLTIVAVVNKLLKYKYIDDNAYMESYINSYSKKYGKQKIKAELLQKGIKKDIIERRLEDFQSAEQTLFKISEKFMRNKDNSLKSIQKLRNHLASKGFTWDEISKAIEQYRGEIQC